MQASLLQVDPEPPLIPFQPVRLTTELVHTRTDVSHKINQYRKVQKIGNGKHGNVYLAEDDDGCQWAMKRIKRVNQQEKKLKSLKRNYQRGMDKANNMDSAMNSIRKEIEILKHCRHPSIVRLMEVIDDPTDGKVYLIQENLAGGPVEWKTNGSNEPLLTLAQTLRIIRDVLLGLEYLHSEGIVHRDLKPYNIIYTTDRRSVKLIDFGVAHYSPAPPASSPSAQRSKGKERTAKSEETSINASLFPPADLQKRLGTPSFLAPEIVWFYEEPSDAGTSSESASLHNAASFELPRQRPPVTNAIDIWSLGITFYGFLFGHLPFEVTAGSFQNVHHSEYTIYNQISRQDWDAEDFMGADHVPTGGRHPKDETKESTLIINLLDSMLQKNPERRATLAEIKVNPWILKNISNPNQWLQVTSPLGVSRPSNSSWVRNAGMKIMKFIPGPR